jgi:teichuronic acid biosynthesis glycosyltransferase TuaC
MAARPISILTFTTLFPNEARPSHGIFVANRLEKLVESGAVRAHVIAPIPWRPPFFDHHSLGRMAPIPASGRRAGIAVEHPRYITIPKIGMNLAPALLFHAAQKNLRRLLDSGHGFDLIDAHYFYPDGVAAVRLGEKFGLPVVITARGTDVNLIPKFRTPRAMILRAASKAAGLVTVCQALKQEMVGLGVRPDRITVLRNGVDLVRFHPLDRQRCRQTLNLSRRTLLSVGLLVERKGHHHVIRSLCELPATDLLIAGQGPDLASLKALSAQLGVSDRVRFLGNLDPPQLCEAYNAADALVLASSREGWANVLLEAMACGTPVVASAVWGTPEVVAAPEAGVLMSELSAQGVVQGVRRLFENLPDRDATRAYAEKFGWEETTAGQIALFERVLKAPRPAYPNSATYLSSIRP